MNINKKIVIVIFVVLFLVVGAFLINERKKRAAEKLTIPPISADFYADHNYQAPPSFVEDASLFFDNGSISTSAGSDFSLTAKIDPGSNTEKGINAVQLDLTFDPAILELSKLTTVEPFVQMGSPVIDNKKGSLSATFFIGGSQVDKISDVATLLFHAKSVSADSTVSFASTAQATVNNGYGSMVLGNRDKASIKVSK